MYSKSLRREIEQIIKDEKLNCSIEEFSNKTDLFDLQFNNPISEEFVETFQDKVDWYYISGHQIWTESFIEKFQDKLNWNRIAVYQKLSESFIEKFEHKLLWFVISKHQKLSEPFIEKFQDKVEWYYISTYQKLSEKFIEKHQNDVKWTYISIYQILSESFIEKFKDKVDWSCISTYQKLSEQFRGKYNITIPKTNWLYTSESDKIDYIKENTDYEIKTDSRGYYLELYKSVRLNYYSVYNFHYKYEVGKTYVSNCDHDLTNNNSFGFSSWSKAGALDYYDEGRLLRVKVYVKDIGAITVEQKVRSSKLTIIEEIFDF